jgi:hypothetical protein
VTRTAPTGQPPAPSRVAAPRHPPDWRTMARQDFNTSAGPPVLFDLEPGQLAADDGHGTGDLLELLGDTEVSH